MLGGWEIILILAVVLILFGAKKLPELAKGLGTGIKEFKKATREVTDEIHNATEETPMMTRIPRNASCRPKAGRPNRRPLFPNLPPRPRLEALYRFWPWPMTTSRIARILNPRAAR